MFRRYSMFRRYLAIACFTHAATVAIPAFAQSTKTFVVTNNGASDYRIDGQLDPTLTLYRGHTYDFSVTSPGHPFFIATAGGNPAAPHFSDGVTNNDVTSGTLSFTVPATAPDTLFYQCSVHAAMSGTLLIQDAPAVPATGRIALVTLLVLLLGAGYLARRRNNASC